MQTIVQPINRNLEFNLPVDHISDWHADGVHISHFFNALSIFFPDGERFFIDSVRHYREQISSPELKKAVRGFIGQEAMHGREHEEYNDALIQQGFPAKRYGKIVLGLLNIVGRRLPKPTQLATTIALEHLTAILANALLSNPESFENAEPHFRLLWRWHALEETEHKAVAYDVYQEIFKGSFIGYANRSVALIVVTILFWSLVIPFHIGLVRKSGGAGNIRGWLKLNNFLWGSPGLLRKASAQWLDYFKPGFHPWDHDNAHLLKQIDQLLRDLDGYSTKIPAVA